MFDKCPNEKCGRKCEVLVCAPDGLGCENCKTLSNRNPLSTAGQPIMPRWKAGGQLITHADKMRIKTNRKRADGQFRPEPRWRTTGD